MLLRPGSCAACVVRTGVSRTRGGGVELRMTKAHHWHYGGVDRVSAVGSHELGFSYGLCCFLAGDLGQVSQEL